MKRHTMALLRKSAPLEEAPPIAEPPEDHAQHGGNSLQLAVGALGVVFGDIGTSPLYAFKECFHFIGGTPSIPIIYGIISLIFWSLTLVVTVKYLMFILRADNRGEGGIMALIALITPDRRRQAGAPVPRSNLAFIFLGLFGAALLYGDGIITPAISVLSAIEGLQVATPAFQKWVVPVTVGILIGIFSIQRRGTARIGAFFGPITLLWFITLAAIGVPWILRHPEIFLALNPVYAWNLFELTGMQGFLILGAVVLCITGGEALYADMGHFGKRPIRIGWMTLVFPALLLNYLGQGALVLERGAVGIENPFYGLVSGWMTYPLVIIATLATVIASQALITGAYSLTQQAVQLGYLPRIAILHTSRETKGQIYVPRVNSLLMVGCIALVIFFRKSSNLAAAYGIAVTGTMAITSVLFFLVARQNWNWSRAKAGTIVGLFLAIDLAFFFANIHKVTEGGWIPLALASALFVLMSTWKRGRQALSRMLLEIAMPINQFLRELSLRKTPRVEGTAVFLTVAQDIAPPVMLQHYKHNHVFHENVLLLSVVTENRPFVEDRKRLKVTELRSGFKKVVARYGYMETPDMSEILIFCLDAGLPIDPNNISFYVGRETLLPTGDSGLSPWRKRLFIFLSRNARPATDYFGLPPDQVIEIGSQITI